MVKRTVVWTKTAASQRRKILEYWNKRNKSTLYSEKLISITAEHLTVIARLPEAFRESEIDNVHESSMGHFSIYYKFSDDQVIVMAFWDNRQNPKKLLDLIS